MQKKLIFLALTGLLCLSLAGCGQSGSTSPEGGSSPQAEQPAEETAGEDGGRTPEEDGVDTEAPQYTDNFSIEWRILPELTARGTFSFTSQNNRGDIYKCAKHTDFDSYTGDDYARKGSYEYTTGESFNYETNITLNYSKTFADKHQVFVGLGYNMAQNKNESYTVVAEGISNINMDFLGMASKYKKDGYPSGTEGISRRMGAIANANYTYDNRYFIDVSGKVEGGSAFGSDNRYAPFWSVGLGWNIHREHFWTM